jgi:hypothetical protein
MCQTLVTCKQLHKAGLLAAGLVPAYAHSWIHIQNCPAPALYSTTTHARKQLSVPCWERLRVPMHISGTEDAASLAHQNTACPACGMTRKGCTPGHARCSTLHASAALSQRAISYVGSLLRGMPAEGRCVLQAVGNCRSTGQTAGQCGAVGWDQPPTSCSHLHISQECS